jgi:hypothetical protein
VGLQSESTVVEKSRSSKMSVSGDDGRVREQCRVAKIKKIVKEGEEVEEDDDNDDDDDDDDEDEDGILCVAPGRVMHGEWHKYLFTFFWCFRCGG